MKSITKNFLCLALAAVLTVSLLPSSFASDDNNPEEGVTSSAAVSEEAATAGNSAEGNTDASAGNSTESNTDTSAGNSTESNTDTSADHESQSEQGSETSADATPAPESSPDAGQADSGENTEDPAESPSVDGEDTGEDDESDEDVDEDEDKDEDVDEDEESSFSLYVIDASRQAIPDSITYASERQKDGYYPTFAAALACALDGDTIKICQDTSVIYSEPIEKSITIDMAGNSFTGPLICAAENLIVKEGIISAADDVAPPDNADESESENTDSDNESEDSSSENSDSSTENEESGEYSEYAVINRAGCTLTLENCVVTGPLSGSFALTSGTFTTEPDADQVAAGYYIQASNDLYTVVRGIAFIPYIDKDAEAEGIEEDFPPYLTPVVEDGTLTLDIDATVSLEDLESYALNNNASSIVIHSKMAAEALEEEELLSEEEKAENADSMDTDTEDSSDDSSEDSSETVAPPNTVITDASGSVFFSSVAEGGSLKLTDTSVTEKSTLRFQYTFIVPVDPEDLTWSWKVYYYNEAKGKNYSLTIHGVKYSTNEDGSITSNAIITNIPSSVYNTSLNAVLTLSFDYDGLSYTITQNLPGATSVTQSTPETRSVYAVAAHLYNSTENDYTDYYYSIASES